MTELGEMKIVGTTEGDDRSLKLDENSILAKPEVIRALGVFQLVRLTKWIPMMLSMRTCKIRSRTSHMRITLM